MNGSLDLKYISKINFNRGAVPSGKEERLLGMQGWRKEWRCGFQESRNPGIQKFRNPGIQESRNSGVLEFMHQQIIHIV